MSDRLYTKLTFFNPNLLSYIGIGVTVKRTIYLKKIYCNYRLQFYLYVRKLN